MPGTIGQARFTKDQLLLEARAAGFDVTGRLVSDWVTLGLLDKAERRGRGRGRGVSGTWPEQQRHLFLTLLKQRAGMKHVVPLLNVPTFVWLWFGDEFVPLRQVRRALSTWAGANERSSSWAAARTAAENLTAQFAHPDASTAARRRFTDTIAHTIYGRPFDAEAVLGSLREVFDPRAEGRVVGPPSVEFRPEYFVGLLRDRLAAIRALREGPAVPDAAFLWSRNEYVVTRRDYMRSVPEVAQDPEAAAFFFQRTAGGILVPDVTLEEAANKACVDLLTLIGLYLEHIANRDNPPP